MTEPTRGYRELIVWQKAMGLVPAVYRLVKRLPPEGFCSAIRPAHVLRDAAQKDGRLLPMNRPFQISSCRQSLSRHPWEAGQLDSG